MLQGISMWFSSSQYDSSWIVSFPRQQLPSKMLEASAWLYWSKQLWAHPHSQVWRKVSTSWWERDEVTGGCGMGTVGKPWILENITCFISPLLRWNFSFNLTGPRHWCWLHWPQFPCPSHVPACESLLLLPWSCCLQLVACLGTLMTSRMVLLLITCLLSGCGLFSLFSEQAPFTKHLLLIRPLFLPCDILISHSFVHAIFGLYFLPWCGSLLIGGKCCFFASNI